MSEEQTTYKVTDRRLFNADGSPREVPPDERPEEKPVTIGTGETPGPAEVASPPESTAANGTVGGTVGAAKTQAPQQAGLNEEAGTHREEDELPGADDPASFASFLMSIASNAASALGMMEHPVTGKREVDLELGKHWIDVLGMLQQKTRGNLLPQEQQILEGLLADLRMQYVSLTNAAPKARTFTGRDIVGG
jgi:hypothetical protein